MPLEWCLMRWRKRDGGKRESVGERKGEREWGRGRERERMGGGVCETGRRGVRRVSMRQLMFLCLGTCWFIESRSF